MKQRTNAWVNIAAFVAGVISAVTGVVLWLMPQGGYQGGRGLSSRPVVLGMDHALWNDIHVWSSLALVVLVLVHLALHWCWIKKVPMILSGGKRKAAPQMAPCES